MSEYKREKPERGYYPDKPPMTLGWIDNGTVEDHLAEALHELSELRNTVIDPMDIQHGFINEIEHHIRMAWQKSK